MYTGYISFNFWTEVSKSAYSNAPKRAIYSKPIVGARDSPWLQWIRILYPWSLYSSKNEKAVSKVINELTQKGANVIYKSIEEIHVSGHACEQELKLLQSILKPKYFVPVHGEYKHLRKHILIAEEVGLQKEKSFILENGDVLSLNRKSACISGKVQAGNVLVDGIGIGDVGNIVLRDTFIQYHPL